MSVESLRPESRWVFANDENMPSGFAGLQPGNPEARLGVSLQDQLVKAVATIGDDRAYLGYVREIANKLEAETLRSDGDGRQELYTTQEVAGLLGGKAAAVHKIVSRLGESLVPVKAIRGVNNYGSGTIKYIAMDALIRGRNNPEFVEFATAYWPQHAEEIRDYLHWPTAKEFADAHGWTAQSLFNYFSYQSHKGRSMVYGRRLEKSVSLQTLAPETQADVVQHMSNPAVQERSERIRKSKRAPTEADFTDNAEEEYELLLDAAADANISPELFQVITPRLLGKAIQFRENLDYKQTSIGGFAKKLRISKYDASIVILAFAVIFFHERWSDDSLPTKS